MAVILANIIAIYRKELQGYFKSPFYYIIAGAFWLISGYLFVRLLLAPDGLIAQVAIRDQMGITEPPFDVPYQFLSIYLASIGTLSLFVLPMLSMGLYSEERKRGTLELLATSPITNWCVAVGKLLGALTFYVTLILPLMLYQTIALSASNPPVNPTVMLLAHAGLILLAATVLSLGMFLSSLTDSSIFAAILTFILVIFLWLLSPIAGNTGGWFGALLSHFSLLQQFTNLIQGIFDTSGIVLFLSLIFLGIFLTAQSIDALRFQRS